MLPGVWGLSHEEQAGDVYTQAGICISDVVDPICADRARSSTLSGKFELWATARSAGGI
jgi:hypothetical protein